MEGKVLGRCRIVRKIGEGGMGAVYLARHETLAKDVAVKILSDTYASNQEFVRRFLREAQSAARLDHPNVIPVLDAASADGVHFIVMQYVDGQDLQDIIGKRKRIGVRDALSITKKVAQALGAAHKLGIVHRDVKPSNIMITKQGRVMVSDFGLARDVSGGGSLTSAEQIIGTPHYISPEQATGQKVDGRSDIYSLGATLYCMLSGTPPYQGTNAISTVLKHVQPNEKPKPLREIDPSTPQEIEGLVAKMMEKSPGRRFQTAGELVEAIDRVKGPASGGSSHSVVLTPRHKGKLVLAGAGAAAGVLLLVLILTKFLGPDPGERAWKTALNAQSDEEKLIRLEDVIRRFPGSEWAKKADDDIKAVRLRMLAAEIAGIRALAESGNKTHVEVLARLEAAKQRCPWGTPDLEALGGEISLLFLERELEEILRLSSESAAFRDVIARIDAARAAHPSAAQRIEELELGIQTQRVVARTRELGLSIQADDAEKLVVFFDPVKVREAGAGVTRAFVRLWLNAMTGAGGKLEEFEIHEDQVTVQPRIAARVPGKYQIYHSGRRERVKNPRAIDWIWADGDWYLKERPRKKDS